MRLSKIIDTQPVADAGGASSESVAMTRPSLMKNIGFSVLFLGGFAHSAVKSFDFNKRKLEIMYLHTMCLSFMVSMWVMVFSDAYTSMMSMLGAVYSKKHFARSTFTFYICVNVMSYVCVLALLLGMSVMGGIKGLTGVLQDDVEWIVLTGALFVCIASTMASYYLVGAFHTVFSSQVNNRNSAIPDISIVSILPEGTLRSSAAGPVDFDPELHVRFTAQLSEEAWTAGFISGNICYEILFSDAVSEYIGFNRLYFILLTIAFSCSLLAVITTTVSLLCFGELRSKQAKFIFAVKISKLKDWMFVFSFGSLFFWIMACCWLGEVKYKGAKKTIWPSCVFGPIGACLLMAILLRIKVLSDRIDYNTRRDEKNISAAQQSL